MKIIYIIGKSSSGKDTVFNILKEKLDVNTYVMYTTRPKRSGEIDGITYNFLSDDQMKNLVEEKKNNKVIEYRTYNTIYGPWTYATIEDNQFKSKKDILMLGTLESYIKIKEYFNKKSIVIPIYLEVPDNIRLYRALKREEQQEHPRYDEMCRRFLSDCTDFSEEKLQEAGITKRFQDIDGNKCAEEISEYIKQF